MVRPLDPQNARLLVEPVYGPSKNSALPPQWRRRQRAGKSLTDRPRSGQYAGRPTGCPVVSILITRCSVAWFRLAPID